MIINYGVTTAVVVAIFLLSLLLPDFTHLSTNTKILLWMGFAIALSLLLVRHSYSFWLGLDFWVKPRSPEDAPCEVKSNRHAQSARRYQDGPAQHQPRRIIRKRSNNIALAMESATVTQSTIDERPS